MPSLEGEIRRLLRKQWADLPADAPVSLHRLPHRGSHEIVLARTATRPARQLIVKAPRRRRTAARHETLRRRAETEYHVLTEIAPRISANNPSLRCPRVLGYEPDAAVLFLEMVDGESLRSLLFGFGRARYRRRLAGVLRLSAEWLSRLHEVTRSEHERNPFDWVLAELAFPETRRVLRAYVGEAAYQELTGLATRFRSEYPEFRKPLCRIHGSFLPQHVMVDGAGIYVLDLEASRLGFPYEDLALFAAHYDLSAPWRRFIAERRMKIEEQTALCWRVYSGDVESPAKPELILRRFTRLLGMTRFVMLGRCARYGEDVGAAAGAFADTGSASLAPSEAPARSLKAHLLGPWWRYRLRVGCRQELQALRHA